MVNAQAASLTTLHQSLGRDPNSWLYNCQRRPARRQPITDANIEDDGDMDLDGLSSEGWTAYWTRIAMLACFVVAIAILVTSTGSAPLSNDPAKVMEKSR